MKKKTISKKNNKKLLIILPLVVMVGLCIFFAIHKKTNYLETPNNNNYSISHLCVEAKQVQTNDDQGNLLNTSYTSQCMCMVSENGSEPMFVDILSHDIQDIIIKPTTQEAEQSCEATCQQTCEETINKLINENKDFKLPKRW